MHWIQCVRDCIVIAIITQLFNGFFDFFYCCLTYGPPVAALLADTTRPASATRTFLRSDNAS